MKNKIKYLLLCSSLLLSVSLVSSSCSKKTGCPINENAGVQANKKGALPTKNGKSSLFPKNMKKKKKRRG